MTVPLYQNVWRKLDSPMGVLWTLRTDNDPRVHAGDVYRVTHGWMAAHAWVLRGKNLGEAMDDGAEKLGIVGALKPQLTKDGREMVEIEITESVLAALEERARIYADDNEFTANATLALIKAYRAKVSALDVANPPSGPRTLAQEIASAINRHSVENGSNTPDFLLAEYLVGCLGAWNTATIARDKWYGVRLAPGQGEVSMKVADHEPDCEMRTLHRACTCKASNLARTRVQLDRPIEDFMEIPGSSCPDCGNPQYDVPSGKACKNGHGY